MLLFIKTSARRVVTQHPPLFIDPRFVQSASRRTAHSMMAGRVMARSVLHAHTAGISCLVERDGGRHSLPGSNDSLVPFRPLGQQHAPSAEARRRVQRKTGRVSHRSCCEATAWHEHCLSACADVDKMGVRAEPRGRQPCLQRQPQLVHVPNVGGIKEHGIGLFNEGMEQLSSFPSGC